MPTEITGDVKAQDIPQWDLAGLGYKDFAAEVLSSINSLYLRASRFSARYNTANFWAQLDGKHLCEVLREYEAIMQEADRQIGIARLLAIENSAGYDWAELLDKVFGVYVELQGALVFFLVRIRSLPADLFEYLLGDRALREYKNFLGHQRTFTQYTLSEQEERLMCKNERIRQALSLFYNNAIAGLSVEVDYRGNRVSLDFGTVISMLYGGDRDARRQGYLGLMRATEGRRNIFTHLLNIRGLSVIEECNLRGFDKPSEQFMLANRIDPVHVDAMMYQVERHYHLARQYLYLKAGAMAHDRLRPCDLFAPITNGSYRSIPFNWARQWIVQTARGLHPVLYKNVSACFEEKTIHARPHEGKEPGACSIALSPNMRPYISVNYHGSLRDVFLLAHEIGHAVHYRLAQRQSYVNYMPMDLVAETAGIFFETALTGYLLRNTPQGTNALEIMAAWMDSMFITLFRQHSIVRFEDAFYRKRLGGFVSPEVICDIWLKTQRELMGDIVDLRPDYGWAWAHISHLFHRPFYCYSYIFAFLAASIIWNVMEEDTEGIEKIISIYEKGGRCSPYDLIQAMGYEPEDSVVWQKAFDQLAVMLHRFSKEIGR